MNQTGTINGLSRHRIEAPNDGIYPVAIMLPQFPARIIGP